MRYCKTAFSLLTASCIIVATPAYAMDGKKPSPTKGRNRRTQLFERLTLREGDKKKGEQGLQPILTAPPSTELPGWYCDAIRWREQPEQPEGTTPYEQVTQPELALPSPNGLQNRILAARVQQAQPRIAVPPPIPPHHCSKKAPSKPRNPQRPEDNDSLEFCARSEREETTTSQPNLPQGSPPKEKATPDAHNCDEPDYAPVVESREGTLVVEEKEEKVPAPPTRRPPSPDPEELEAVDHRGRTQLWIAVVKGDREAVEALLLAGANACTMKDGDSLLHEAARSRRCPPAILDSLTQRGLDPNALNGNGFAPLHMAVRAGEVEKVRTLVQACGADVNLATQATSQQSKGRMQRTALHLAATCKSVKCREIANFLLESCTSQEVLHALLYAPDEHEKTALELATDAKNLALVVFFLHHTEIGHVSVQKAYAFCTDPNIRALFDERPDKENAPVQGSSFSFTPPPSQSGSEEEEENYDGDDEEDPEYRKLSHWKEQE